MQLIVKKPEKDSDQAQYMLWGVATKIAVALGIMARIWEAVLESLPVTLILALIVYPSAYWLGEIQSVVDASERTETWRVREWLKLLILICTSAALGYEGWLLGHGIFVVILLCIYFIWPFVIFGYFVSTLE